MKEFLPAKPGKNTIDDAVSRAFLFICAFSAFLLACQSTTNSSDGKSMKVKVVSLEQCAATQPTIALVKEVAGEEGVDIKFEHVIVKTREEAIAHRHIGSPTMQVNGLDIEPGARELNQFGLT